ncbi:GNAT family N-acetyltransferase [Propioniciclava coleopterorum]|uniref:GNAT family N-acetyltransferase n=1 Tax=Propioniciclava coleopterorum TaxID=2714937 RepID=UPI001FE915AF|nr:GNAT family N-acetyltransferase [Propioniciclava coleopterorum]
MSAESSPAVDRPGDSAVRIRLAEPGDVPDLHRLICALAEYEKEPDAVVAVPDDLTRVMFGDHPSVFGHVVEEDGRVVGMALWFLNYSTWTGRNGLYLEDLFIEPEHRGRGFGRDLLITLARLAIERGYSRFEWTVLDWNTPSLDFYRSLGAFAMDEWTVQRVDDHALAALAALPLGSEPPL